mmetsp:Transcript_15383/g.23178  ORF Transcript_15383/g.23178 Transcript_15383/m.23178 type:complete len:267 (+) Transcript_15383:172-972(+)|eukprot:CAMPEP_0185017802 /NCGR_PEP_ID=MMETSP1103-20130426/691_1 /TAXON_ID=36769 /ORGANISM="Paraphysomonas bandaiensis, Strain Caron Lab Isolate" /LENGTH=266 /DNA_ID=CAMNT_0027547377 /DNA_START=108 /DNA_END=908 /DNA_ORIENTATION=-
MIDNVKYIRNEKIHFKQLSFGATSNGSDSGKGSLAIGESEKRHFEPQRSSSREFHPSCRMVEHMERCPDEVVIPKRRPQLHTLKFTAADRYRDRRHVRESDLPCVKNPKEKELNWTRKKTVRDGNNTIVSAKSSGEYQIETTINRKQRIPSITRMRNGIPIANPGDKSYRDAEKSIGFYKEGGLIAGSSINPRPAKVLKGSAETMHAGKSLKSLTAFERRENNISDSDRAQVEMLTNSQYKRGQEVPCWEEKTGMWLCNPAEEEDD